MVEIIKTGLYDSIQDLGRHGFQHYGVPFSGAMDKYSAKLANAMLDNPLDSAVIEFTLIGPKLKFHEQTKICISGAESNPKLNDELIKNNQVIKIMPNDTLSFGACEQGVRGYIAIFGGFRTKEVMGSRSMYTNITGQSRLKTEDLLPIESVPNTDNSNPVSVNISTSHFNSEYLEVMPGIEFQNISQKVKRKLFEQSFTVSSVSNRMAYQCNETIKNNLSPIITSMVLPGTVQLTPSGQIVILMRDCQTTGGYPRILQLTEKSIDRLSQRKTGDFIRFSRNFE